MAIKFRYVTPLLAAAAAAAAITVAPTAAATNPSACMNTGRSTVCQKPGHAEISIPDHGAAPSTVYGPFVPPYFPWR
jgi:hypothetical protein